jgi:hypothetical protein
MLKSPLYTGPLHWKSTSPLTFQNGAGGPQQVAWLEHVLQEAKRKDERAVIISHVLATH